MPRPVGINHVAVEVGSIDEALAFLEQLFGEVELRGRGRSMAFVDLGDQFIALSAGRTQPPDGDRHIGLVVDGREETLERARAAGARMLADLQYVPFPDIAKAVPEFNEMTANVRRVDFKKGK